MIQTMPSDYKAIINNCIDMAEDPNVAALNALPTSTTTADLLMGDQFPHMMLEGDSDETESAVSGALEEDPNDPEWFEPAPRS